MNEKKLREAVDFMLVLCIIVFLAALLWMVLATDGEAQGQYWYLTTHYRWEWLRGRWVRVAYPVVCSGYICKPACRSYYGGWGPCYGY